MFLISLFFLSTIHFTQFYVFIFPQISFSDSNNVMPLRFPILVPRYLYLVLVCWFLSVTITHIGESERTRCFENLGCHQQSPVFLPGFLSVFHVFLPLQSCSAFCFLLYFHHGILLIPFFCHHTGNLLLLTIIFISCPWEQEKINRFQHHRACFYFFLNCLRTRCFISSAL